MAWTRAALALIVAAAVAAAVVSGGHSADPRTPTGLPGLPPPFLGTAVAGSGELTAAVDAYGGIADLRPSPAGRALVDNPAERQAAGTVSPHTGIVPRVSLDRGPLLPLWRADSVEQSYLAETNVVRTAARFDSGWAEVVYAALGNELACIVRSSEGATVTIAAADPGAAARLRCEDRRGAEIVRGAIRADRRWLARARPLGAAAPAWARRLYGRSLLTLRALTGRNGAVAAGARDGWAYVWPRDAGTAALALAAAGYAGEARRVARFLRGLDLGAAARFHGDGTPVPGRAAQGDAAGWVAVAARAAGVPLPASLRAALASARDGGWRLLADYQEGEPGDYLANAIASSGDPAQAGAGGDPAAARSIGREFGTRRGLARRPKESADLDSAAAWAVAPFPQPTLYPAARRTLLELAGRGTRLGIVPSTSWDDPDPWTAPTAWSAWSLAKLGNRRAALGLLTDLRRAATPAGALPERVDVDTGIPRSTTPLAWSHAFAILALRQLWP